MTDTPNPLDPIKQYLISIALKKVSLAVAKFGTALFGSVGVQTALTKYGVHVDPAVFIPSATTALLAALELAHDYVKLKTGWGWL